MQNKPIVKVTMCAGKIPSVCILRTVRIWQGARDEAAVEALVRGGET